MAKKRKHNNVEDSSHNHNVSLLIPPKKRRKISMMQQKPHPILANNYSRVLSLRQYLLEVLPASSKHRRRKIRDLPPAADEAACTSIDTPVSHLLDTTLVCVDHEVVRLNPAKNGDIERRWLLCTQTLSDESRLVLERGSQSIEKAQAEIVNHVIWCLFQDVRGRPKNLLCDGYRRGVCQGSQQIPGIQVVFRNSNVEIVKSAPWPALLALLGVSGQSIMIELLLRCSIYVAVKAGNANLLQVTGTPLFELAPPPRPRQPSEITFARSRILYARPALNARGIVSFGLRQVHDQSELDTIKVMMYMFPRQFGLQNVFTPPPDQRTALKPFDHVLREEEITDNFDLTIEGLRRINIPKRLRGATKELVAKLRQLHSKCSYSSILEHYCPIPSAISEQIELNTHAGITLNEPRLSQHNSTPKKKGRKTITLSQRCRNKEVCLDGISLYDLATPSAQVSALCQAICRKVIPDAFWGIGDDQAHNWRVFLKHIDHFVLLRRFETISLHELCQNMRISSLEWLTPPHIKGLKTSASEIAKRLGIFHEFLYSLFDFFLIPLIRGNFYVTEAHAHRNRIFYFRHDVWKEIAEPELKLLKSNMLEEVKLQDAREILDERQMGYSLVRLLPKPTGVRPIMNLKRRQPVVTNNGQVRLGKSINSILAPVQAVFKRKKNLHPETLGSSMFAVGDMYERLKAFKRTILPNTKLFFAKVDVQAAFDTIPQRAVVRLMCKNMHRSTYNVSQYVEAKPTIFAGYGSSGADKKFKPACRWQSRATPRGQNCALKSDLESLLAVNKSRSIFVDTAKTTTFTEDDIRQLLVTHVRKNLVKIGKKYFRQKKGIPQGSVLSSTLCSYFYAKLERRHLKFINTAYQQDGSLSLLLRLIDDFLLITTSTSVAEQFVKTMHKGFPKYGVTVNPSKTLVNFPLNIEGVTLSRPEQQLLDCADFPYCGLLINMNTLDVTKDSGNFKTPGMSIPYCPNHPLISLAYINNQLKKLTFHAADVLNSLTVSYSARPGMNFHRKVLSFFRIQSHPMFYDSSFLSCPQVVLHNLRRAFNLCALKTCAYLRTVPSNKQPRPTMVIYTIVKLVDTAHGILAGAARRKRTPGYEYHFRKGHIVTICADAFEEVFRKKQTKFGYLLEWLQVWAKRDGNKFLE